MAEKVIFMSGTMNVLSVKLNDYTAKDAMKVITEYMETETVNTVEIVTADILMRVAQTVGLKENLEQLDMVLAGDEAILEAAGIEEKKKLQEAHNRVFMKMVLRYFHKSHRKLFILADSEGEAENLSRYLQEEYGTVKVAGTAVVPNDESADDMITNQINGAEVDCILASLASPKQEAFIVRCKNVLSARLWLGIGRETTLFPKKENWLESLKDFFERKILKRQMEKEKNRTLVNNVQRKNK